MHRAGVRLTALLALLMAAWLLPRAASAQIVNELKVGGLWHDVPNLWSGFQLERDVAAVNVEAILSPSLPLLFGSIRPAIGANINTGGYTSNVYLDARWQIEMPVTGLFLGLGVGATVHDGKLDPSAWDRKALGGRTLFHFPLEVGWRFDGHSSISVYFDHISNGYTREYNEGLDRLGVRYGYRF